jgi:hypothetical protein
MRPRSLLLTLALLASCYPYSASHAQAYPPGNAPPGRPPPPGYGSPPMSGGGPPPYAGSPAPYGGGQASSSENCGTPDDPKPCPPMPRHPLPYYPGNRP